MKPAPVRCPICERLGLELDDRFNPHDDGVYLVSCKLCGSFKITGHTFSLVSNGSLKSPPEPIRRRVISLLRHMSDVSATPFLVTAELFEHPDSWPLMREPSVPEKLRKTLALIAARTPFLGSGVNIHAYDWPLIGAYHEGELIGLLRGLKELELVKLWETEPHKRDATELICQAAVTIRGFQQHHDWGAFTLQGRRVFVAMWFDESMAGARIAIRNAIENDCNLIAVFADEQERTDDVTIGVLGDIRGANLVVADFSGLRGGVYFEAGFALGLGLQVIWTCRRDYFQRTEEPRLHVDTNHFNAVLWSDPLELRAALARRIKGIFPPATSPQPQ